MSDLEMSLLDRIAHKSLYNKDVHRDTIVHSFKIFSRHFRGDTILELGPAEGVMTELLVVTGKKITVVDGSKTFCLELRRRLPEISVINSLFENFDTSKKFDNVILGHVLEHVENPLDILRLAREWLAPNGRIFAAVPNARSLHRQAAVLMGILPTEDSLNEMDRHHGHRRVFSPETFRNVFYHASLDIDIFGGYWLKPVSNQQIEDNWSESMLDAFMKLGERYPDIAGEIYVIASLPNAHHG